MDPGLEELATAYGVATSYEDWQRRRVEVPEKTVRRVLEGLGVEVDQPEQALRDADEHRWRRLIPPTVVVIEGARSSVDVLAPEPGEPVVELRLENGRRRPLPAVGPATEHQVVAGHHRSVRPLVLPADLPPGYHELRVVAGPDGAEESTAVLAVVPARVPVPPGLGRAWGWMVQLYAVRSAGSWGLGDYADLAELAGWSGREFGAGVLLVNPLHAVAPAGPVQNSPYYPASRRFSSPLYLRPELLPEYGAAPEIVRGRVDELADGFEAGGDAHTRIDRDAAWAAKLAALELLFPHRIERPDAEVSQGLTDFATWCALSEVYGPDWREWPDELHDPHGEPVTEARARLGERVALHAWLQSCCDEQLAAAQAAAAAAGMPVGIVHDLAVGVDPGGADAWALQADLASGFTVGAPPDAFNQQGQDWRLPPWRPDRLAETGYAPFRDMVRAVLRKGGGLRVDHVLGLFRLWWVPEGASAAKGTYITYDAAAMLGILALEAERAGALVVGEDLGTVPDHVRAVLAERGVLGSAVLWFEKDEDTEEPLPPARWRDLAVASVTTHDLPTVAGWFRDEQVRLRARLGLLTRSEDEELAAARAEKSALIAAVRAEGLLPDDGTDPDEQTVALALHLLLARGPSRVVLAALGDALGDLRQPNLPGTIDEYPNWRLPLADSTGRPVPLEVVEISERVARLARALRDGLGSNPD
jgi:4-alpha-glucanotransferase